MQGKLIVDTYLPKQMHKQTNLETLPAPFTGESS